MRGILNYQRIDAKYTNYSQVKVKTHKEEQLKANREDAISYIIQTTLKFTVL